jgi:hypothetical protein
MLIEAIWPEPLFFSASIPRERWFLAVSTARFPSQPSNHRPGQATPL